MTKISTKKIKTTSSVTIGTTDLTFEDYISVVKYKARVQFSEAFKERAINSRDIIDRFLERGDIIYGVTTGFGENVRYTIDPKDAVQLQKNIVRSHACSVGEPLDEEKIRSILLMMILNTGSGHSGIRLETLEVIRNFLNNNIIPFAPGDGSVGYLGVEAHIALTFMGEGYILKDGKKTNTMEVLNGFNITPVIYQCKEGLSLTNGSMTVTAIAMLALYEMVVATKNIVLANGLVYEALKGTVKALDLRIHKAKHHSEQYDTAQELIKILEGSEISAKFIDDKVQDAYVLRAIPQMIGSVKKLVNEAYEVITDEMHSCSDNPEIFSDEQGDAALMCGNFDGSYVGSHCDMLCIAASIAGNFVERNTDRMVNRNLNGGLPAFLVVNPGLNNGYMITQYTSAGLLNEIKTLSTPATIDSVSTCANQEDPVSMAFNAAKKAHAVAKKLQYMIAIEVLVALQAIDLLKPLAVSPANQKIYDCVRKNVSFLEEDRYIHPDIEHIYELVKELDLVSITESAIGEITL